MFYGTGPWERLSRGLTATFLIQPCGETAEVGREDRGRGGGVGRRAQQDAAPGSAGTDCPIPRNGVNGAHLAPRAQGTEPRSLTPSSALVPPALTPFPLRVEQSRLLAGLPARGGGLQRAPIPACVPYSNPTASFHPAPVADRPHRGGDVPWVETLPFIPAGTALSFVCARSAPSPSAHCWGERPLPTARSLR